MVRQPFRALRGERGFAGIRRFSESTPVLRIPLFTCARLVFVAFVGDTKLPLLLEALGSVDAELARVHYALREFAAWPASDSPDIVRARAAIRRAFMTVRAMREALVAPAFASVEARASSLRARSIVIQLQLAQLRGVNSIAFAMTEFGTLEAFASYVLAAIGRANTVWVGHPNKEAVLSAAEDMYADVGREPRIRQVLARGLVSSDLHTRLTCATLAALLDASLGTLPAAEAVMRMTEVS